MSRLPTGTVTFLFTDIVGSTQLLEQLHDRYAEVLAEHRRMLRAAFAEAGGQEIDTQGDAFFVAFSRAKDALLAAVSAQRAFHRHLWTDGAVVRVRMGIHTGEPLATEAGYVGIDVHRAARLCQAGHGGQILVSQTTRDLIAGELPAGISLLDLGAQRLKDLSEPQRVFQVVATDLPAEFSPIRSLGVIPNNLPRQLTSFVGREREQEEIKRLLAQAYLVTLSGAGGCGKTRLTIHVAAEIMDQFPDGVWFVELAPLSDPALVAQTVATVLGVREHPGRQTALLIGDFLKPKQALLILDNCEHIVAATAQLAHYLMRFCPRLRILATSRQPLGVEGESTYVVRPLAVPDMRRPPPLEQLAESGAIRLFIDRAVSVVPTFEVSVENAPAVVQVCSRLDGIPLAIELAAARVKVLTVQQIAARLDDRFRLLTAGRPTDLAHHQTLNALLDWSYDLLADRERVVFRRVAVFAGGFGLEAAEAVSADVASDEFYVLDVLSALVDKSLVVADDKGMEIRYRLLETIRQYDWGKLVESGDDRTVRDRHRDFMLNLAEEADGQLWAPGQKRFLNLLETEHDNLRTALDWSLSERTGGATGPRLASALGWFWYLIGYASEGQQWLESALREAREIDVALRAKVLNRAGLLAWYQGAYTQARTWCEEALAFARDQQIQYEIALALNVLGLLAFQPDGDYPRAKAHLGECLTLARETGDQMNTAWALHNLGRVHWRQGEYEDAVRLLEESLRIWRSFGDDIGTAFALHSLGLVSRDRGEFARAVAFHEEGIALMRELGERAHYAVGLNSLGIIARYRGDYARAVSLGEESLVRLRELGDKSGVSLALNNLGLAVLRLGEVPRARSLCLESLRIRRDLGDRRGIAEALESLAAVAQAQQQHEKAAELLAGAQAIREAIGAPVPQAARVEYAQNTRALQAALGPDTYEAAWSRGRGMSVETLTARAAQESGSAV